MTDNLSDEIRRECQPSPWIVPPGMWPHTEIGLSFSTDPKEDAQIKAALSRAYEEMMRELGVSMYAESAARPRPTLASRFLSFVGRVRDAWDVLRGRAEIC